MRADPGWYGDNLETLTAWLDVVGTRTVNGWLRIYPQIVDLVRAADSRGYEVWVITASPTDVVGALAPLAGIDSDRVIGIRSVTDRAGRLTYTFEGCGPAPDGNQSMIPYIDGKRCWVNKVVFGDATASAIDRRGDPRQVFLQPRAQQIASYPCSTTGCKLSDGTAAPCLEEGGGVIPDQQDTVF